MQGLTHFAFGANTAWLLLPFTTDPAPIIAASLTSAFFSLLPDLDGDDALIQRLELYAIRPFVPLSIPARTLFGHRGVLHSLTATAVVSAVSVPLALAAEWWLSIPAWAFWLGATLGYVSHLVADALTPTGVPFFAPFAKRRYKLLPRELCVRTGSWGDELLFFVLSGLWMVLMGMVWLRHVSKL